MSGPTTPTWDPSGHPYATKYKGGYEPLYSQYVSNIGSPQKPDWTGGGTLYNRIPTYDITRTRSVSHKGPPYLEGGDFYTVRSRLIRTGDDVSSIPSPTPARGSYWILPGSKCYYYNPTFPLNPVSFSGYPADPVDDSISYGPVGWDKFKPGKPIYNWGQDVWKIHELPMVLLDLKRRLESFHQLGDKFLAAKFGLLPLIEDMKAIYHLQTTLAKQLSFLIANNGKPVRRSGTIHSTSSAGVSSIDGSASLGANWMLNGTATGFLGPTSSLYLKTIGINNITYTFSGRFRYWVPDIGSQRWTDKAVAHLTGLSILDANTWYQIMPWSWLIDWFSNLGSVVDNITNASVDNLVADYAFVMMEYSNVDRYLATQTFANGRSISATMLLSQTMKVRHPASPFGFGLTLSSLTGRQVAVLAALGIQRLRF